MKVKIFNKYAWSQEQSLARLILDYDADFGAEFNERHFVLFSEEGGRGWVDADDITWTVNAKRVKTRSNRTSTS